VGNRELAAGGAHRGRTFAGDPEFSGPDQPLKCHVLAGAKLQSVFFATGTALCANVFYAATFVHDSDLGGEVLRERRAQPAALASGDQDRDGIDDALETDLARRFAPIVILDREDRDRPASVEWLLEREPSALGAAPAAFQEATRRGDPDPDAWPCYVRVYPRVDGGINLQYWFLYAHNDGPGIFDHDTDWEHVTVRLDPQRQPVGLYLAAHEDNAPGVHRRWSNLRTEGDHPVILSARGTHAAYARRDDLLWFESAADCPSLEGCGDPVWRTWLGAGLVQLGEPRAPALAGPLADHPGRWGASSWIPGTAAPYGPFFHRGACDAAFAEHCTPAASFPIR
jgi:hypothetical protein